MARKPLTEEAPQEATSTAALPDGVTDETVIVTGDEGTPADEGAAPAELAGRALPQGVTDETVVVTDEGVASAVPAVPAAPAVAVPNDPTPEPLAGPVVIVTCPVAAGRRRAGRRWPAGVTRVSRAELSDADMAALQGDVMLRVTVEAA